MFFSSKKILSEVVASTDFTLSKYKAVLDKYPEAIIIGSGKSSKFTSEINSQDYTGFFFEEEDSAVYLIPYVTIVFMHDRVEHTTEVYRPRLRIRIAYKKWMTPNANSEINFSSFFSKFKDSDFPLKMFQSCQLRALDFVKKHPRSSLNRNNLNKELKYLLMLI